MNNTRIDFHLERRTKTDLIVSDEVYIDGIFDIVQWLMCDLEFYVKDEGRYFGIMPTYFKDMKKIISSFNSGCTEDDCDIYGKIFYLFKPIIVNEFVRLGVRRLSNADRIIVMIKRILDMLEEEGDIRNHEKAKNFKDLNIIITKMFDRIRNHNKKTDLKFMINTLKQYIDLGKVGKVNIDEWSMKSEISRRDSYFNQPVKNEGTIYSETQGTTLWKGE